MLTTLQFAFGQGIRSDTDIWYRYLQEVGRGKNATTILVVPSSGPYRGVPFALKIFQRTSNEESRRRFLREIAFLQQCAHPAIMRVYDSGVFRVGDEEFPFVVAEYLPLRLYDIIRNNSASIPERLAYSLQLISALDYLASLRPAVVHRDVKPENIFVKGRSCVLGDFGLMKRITATGRPSIDVTRESSGAVMPLNYRTPDLIAYSRGRAQITPKSDVFQLGLVLAELFTGRNPSRPAANEDDDLVLDRLGFIPSEALGGLIHSIVTEMLCYNPATRIDASTLFDKWQTAFFTGAESAYRLNGRVL